MLGMEGLSDIKDFRWIWVNSYTSSNSSESFVRSTEQSTYLVELAQRIGRVGNEMQTMNFITGESMSEPMESKEDSAVPFKLLS